MSYIKLFDVSVDIPIFNTTNQSLKSVMLGMARGEKLSSNDRGIVQVRALEKINLSLSKGTRLGIIGENGAGKSTLLRVLTGVYPPTTGSVEISAQVTSLIDISLGINHEATGRENIILRGALLGLSLEEISKNMDEIIQFTELGHFIDMPVRTYSSGMNLRLAFAISTVITPKILVMDEWLSVGDETFQVKAEDRLQRMVTATDIMVVASHSKNLILGNCNRVIWLDSGKIKADGDPNSVCDQYFRAS